MGGKKFERRLVHSAALTIMGVVLLVKAFIAYVLKCKANLKTRFKCVLLLSDESLLTLFHKTESRLIKVSAMF